MLTRFCLIRRTTSKSPVIPASGLNLLHTGKQNTFYFQASNLLPSDPAHPAYASLYKQIPLVVVLGWTGAKDHNLKKFSDIYTSMGYHTIRFSPSVPMTFFKTKTHKKYTEELLGLLKFKHNLGENRVFIHALSNAGYFIIYQNLIDIYSSKYVPLSRDFRVNEMKFLGENQQGIVFDSALGMPVPFKQLASGIADLVGGNKGAFMLALGSVFGVIAACAVAVYKKMIIPNDYFSKSFRKYNERDTRHLPTLYVYSKADCLISPGEIEKMIDERRQLYPRDYIKSGVFEDAEHVLIFRKYPERYVELIKEHLKVCQLGINKPEAK